MNDVIGKGYQVTFVLTPVSVVERSRQKKMATVLRKNKAWLHELIKRHQLEVVPKLCNSEIISEEAKETALHENVDASTRATVLLNVIEENMSDSIEPCTYGLQFIHVLIESGIDKSGNLEKTAKEFGDEQRRASSRKSSTASVTGCLDTQPCSSYSSVFIVAPNEMGSQKRRGSTESIDSGRKSRKSSSEQQLSDSSILSWSNSESNDYSPQHSESVSYAQIHKSDERPEEQVVDLNPYPLSFSLSPITENPNSPDIAKRRGSKESIDSGRKSRRSLSERKVSDLSIPSRSNSESSGHLPQRSKSVSHPPSYKTHEQVFEEYALLSMGSLPIDSPPILVSVGTQTVIEPVDEVCPGNSDDSVLLNDDQFADELQHCVFAVEPVPCCEDADRAKYQDEQLVMKNELEKLRQYCDNQLSLCEAEKEQLESDKQKEIQRVKKEAAEKLSDTEQQLEERKSQVAELERENHLLQVKMIIAEADRKELSKKLAEKDNYIMSLQENIENNCEKVEELTSGDSDQLMSNERRSGEWLEIKRLLDQLSERKDLLMQTKLAILNKVETIKTKKKKRPHTVKFLVFL